jgi:hypothetical protein
MLHPEALTDAMLPVEIIPCWARLHGQLFKVKLGAFLNISLLCSPPDRDPSQHRMPIRDQLFGVPSYLNVVLSRACKCRCRPA